MNYQQRSRGFIKTIILIVIALIVLGYFGYNLRDIISSPVVRDNLSYAWDLAIKLWNNFLAAPALWIWNNIIIDLVWNNLKILINK